MKMRIETSVLRDEQGNLIGDGLVKIKIVPEIEGEELIESLTNGVNSSIDVLKKRMSGYDRNTLFDCWLFFVRQIDEFINIRYELGEPCEEYLKNIHLDRKSELEGFGSLVEENFGADINARFQDLAGLFNGYSVPEFDGRRPVDSLYDLLVFLQSRRLHIMTILNLIPKGSGDGSLIRLSES